MIKQLLNSVITKYQDLPVSRRSIICLSLRLRQIIDLLDADKSRYFAQPRPIIVKYWLGGKRGTGVLGYGVPGCGKHGVWWKTRGVENTGSGGKHGVWWKTRGLSGKHGV